MDRSYHFIVSPSSPVMFQGKPLAGATLTVEIRFYQKGKEVEVETGGFLAGDRIFHPSSTVHVSFDRNNAFMVQLDDEAVAFYRRRCNIDEVECQLLPDGYSIDVDISGGISEDRQVTEAEFKDFLKAHADLFDIPENQRAQVL